jgi:hypothetical protein
MSTQTPQTDALVIAADGGKSVYPGEEFKPTPDWKFEPEIDAIIALSRTLEAERDHYKALCEELRKAVESAQIAFHFQAIRDAQDAKMCAGWVLLQDQMSAALKKAQKDI